MLSARAVWIVQREWLLTTLLGHQQFILGIGKIVGNTVHSAISEAIPNSVREINETAGWGEEGSHTSLAIVVAFL